jgi:hypothetical protein
MQTRLHKNAKTTFAIRKDIQSSSLSVSELAIIYSLDPKTVRKWRKRNILDGVSSRPHHLRTSLSPDEELHICFERKHFEKSIYDLTDTFQIE